MLAARTLPSVHFSAPSRRATRNQRAAVTVAAAAPVTVTTLPDGRKIEVYPTTADAASAVAASFVNAYKQVVPTKGSMAIAIPSGSVVKALGGLKGVAGVDWSKVHVFFCNERDGGKTFSGDKADFLDVVGIPAANCHPVTGLDNGGDPKAAAAAYEKVLLTNKVISQVNGGPCFDWIGLGTGDDGHCASINPGTDEAKADVKTGPWVLPIAPNAANPKAGITVSLRTLNNAKFVSVSAGEKKRAPMVKRALTNEYEAFGCPAGEVFSTIISGAPKTYVTWFVDVESFADYKNRPATAW